MFPKKYLIIYILKLLESNSDSKNTLTQTKIAREISEVIPCDRKTVGRNINFLIKVGYPIVKTSKGYYMNKKKFTVDEADFILNAVATTSGKTVDEKAVILQKLKDILFKIYR